ncbi:phosphohydrolase [Leptospira biflexa]|nr:phosphohydrolase [Leptospira biflexa]TGM41647.1 phosphohydrolase [Leptospira biflexa]TGM48729.1 phosphohydrolase [Leptospira biflexa]TGM51203.1 phosphohydrolase [Leptospira biflexa]TGM56472.1 phosphohydrolase [Leptospira biflexa]
MLNLRMIPLKRRFKFILIFLLILFFNSFIFERYYVRFPIYEIESTKIPKSFDGYKIAVVSDLHYGFLNPAFWIRYVIGSTNEQNPDLIVGLGDYVKKRNFDEELISVWKLLPLLKAKDIEVFVNGNHDHWANHTLSLRLLEESKKSLRNRTLEIKRGNEKMIIGGLGDFWEDHIPIDQIFQHTDPKQFRIAIAHNPESADTSHKESIDLFITGHTHGGQVRIPFLQLSPILPVQNKNYDLGIQHSIFNEMVFISAGIGWSILPLRFNCPSEVPILILRHKENK